MLSWPHLPPNASMRRLLHLLLLTIALGGSGIAGDVGDQPTAPDGRPGIGGAGSARELARRADGAGEAAARLGEDLARLQSDLVVLTEMARRHYLGRGDFDLVGSGGDLPALHAAFEAALPELELVLERGGARAEVMARLLLDLRFQLRIELLRLARREGAELRRGLALLRGSLDGLYELKDTEARAVAERVDLAAAILRAVRSDLDVLRERGRPGAPGSPDPALAAELERLRLLTAGPERARGHVALRASLEAERQRLVGVLFWPRLEPRVGEALERRQARGAAAVESRAALEQSLAGSAAQELPRQERDRIALSLALRGLDLDPLDEGLTWRMAELTQAVYGLEESQAWFDRYLALQGIRVGKEGVGTERELAEREQRAVEVVLRAVSAPR